MNSCLTNFFGAMICFLKVLTTGSLSAADGKKTKKTTFQFIQILFLFKVEKNNEGPV